MDKDIRIGAPVVTSDGRPVGKVDRIVVCPDPREVCEIVVHQGLLLTKDRIVETTMIASVADDGTVTLDVPSDEVNALPLFYEHEFVVPTASELRDAPYPIAGGVNAGGLTTSPILWRTSFSGRGFQTASRGLFDSAPVDPSAVEKRTNLPENTVEITRGTDVVTSDGEKLGVVADVIYGAGNEIAGIIAAGGLLRHHRYEVHIAQIASFTRDRVTLSVPATDITSIDIEPVKG